MELDKNYDAKTVEAKWQKYWDEQKLFKFDYNSKKPVYSIDTPPPYASSGHLHVGHALHYTQFELMARYKRMRGFNVYFAPCFDNNGLPTEKYVEEKFKISKKDITRAAFRKLCREESAIIEKAYAEKVFKTLGHSYDWDLLYTTIEPEAQKVSQTSFVDLYEKGLVYRSKEPTLWCCFHQTALAQAEIEDAERETTLHYVDFDLEGGGKLQIATTRPEFLAACVGIFVNPEDKKNKRLVGKTAIVPLFHQKVPIMEDKKVDMEFGTGIVMICTFGDKTDIEWWKEFKLPLKMIVTVDGKLNENAGKYAGLTLEEGRKHIVEDLKHEVRIEKQEKLKQNVGTCWRCNKPVEFIVAEHWFIKTLDFKEQLIEQGRKIKWHPEFYRVRYEDWTRNLQWDWCISRQRFYGVPIPAWYCKKCKKPMVADKKDLPIDPLETKPNKKCSCGSSEFLPEEDVFDTWMTSSMSPQCACRWLEKPDVYKKIYPMSLRPQSHDIIRTWAFYTILKSYLHFKSIPWTDIALGTYVLDPHGKGMHKSKGNVVWTHELLDKYSVDIVRYWVGTAKWGEDLPFQEKDCVAGQRFLIKLWNASRFCFMHLADYDGKKPKKLELIDRWLLSKLHKVIKVATERFDDYDSSESKKAAEVFFWHDFCDNYLELVKDRIYNESRGKESKHAAQYTLYTALLSIIKILAPIVPHITEELYQAYFLQHEKAKSIHISEWPKYDEQIVDEETEKIGEAAVEIVSAVRKHKSEKNVSLKAEIKHLKIESPVELNEVLEDIKSVTKALEVSVKKGKETRIEVL